MNKTIRTELDELYAIRDELKLALINQILINDFDGPDTNEIIRELVMVQEDIDRRQN